MPTAGVIEVAPQVLKQLAAGEIVQVQLHQHPMVLIRPVARALAASVVWLWIAFAVPTPGRLLDLTSLAVVGLWLWVGWSELERRNNWIVVTEKRIFQTQGIFTRTVPMMRLSKVTDVTYRRNVAGRLFRYGLIIIESAGQDQALHDLNYIPYPEGTDALKAALFGESPRDRERNAGRWNQLRRKGRGKGRRGDDGSGGSGGPNDLGGSGGSGGLGGSGGPGGSGGSGASGGPRPTHGPVDSRGPFDTGDQDDRSGGGYLPFLDHPAYEMVDPTDVPPAGHRARPAGGGPDDDYGTTIYQSADRRRRSIADEDTGPIPIVQRPRPRHRPR